MKTLIACFVFSLFFFNGSSQALWKVFRDPAVMKKKGIQKIRVYNRDNDTSVNMDTIPYITIYFDPEGRVKKTIILYPAFFDSTMWWQVRETRLDTLGRITLEKTNYSLLPDADQTTFIAYGDVRRYIYEGDSVLLSIDSSRYNNTVYNIYSEKQTWHWEKPSPPNPRPLLWPDSICTSQTHLLKSIDFHYPDGNSSIPDKVDSIWNVEHISWAFQNNKLVGKDITKYYRGEELSEYETIRTYTLNLDYDTAREVTTGRDFREENGKFIYEPVKYNHDTIKSFYTKRKGENYIILVDKGRFDRYKQSIQQTYTTNYPWSNEDIMPFYNEYAIFNHDDGFFPVEGQLRYGKRIEIIYW